MYEILVRRLLCHNFAAFGTYSISAPARTHQHRTFYRLIEHQSREWRASLLIAVLSWPLILLLSGCGAYTVNGRSANILFASPGTVTFGSLPVGQTTATDVILTNQGSSPVEVSRLDVSGDSFSAQAHETLPFMVPAGGVYRVTVQFNPVTVGTISGELAVASSASTTPSAAIRLHGTGTESKSTASKLSCASDSMTGSGTDRCTVTLSADAPRGGVLVGLSSSDPAVTVPDKITVHAKEKKASFNAAVSAVSSAQSATLTANAGGVSATFALHLGSNSTTAAAQTIGLSISSTSVSFGNVVLNTPATQSVTLTSTGTAAVTISSVASAGTGFTDSGLSLPLTLNPGQTATLNAQFDPTAAGAKTGQLTITSNASTNGTAIVALSGTGISDAIELNWDAPGSSTVEITGYHIYRSTKGNSSYQMLNQSADTETTYRDNTVQNGVTYDYYVTSVDSSGVESGPSNSTSLTVP